MKKLYIRHIDCGHTRPTSLDYLFCDGQNIPKVGDFCYCRKCLVEGKVIKVEEADAETVKSFDDYKEKVIDKILVSKEDKR